VTTVEQLERVKALVDRLLPLAGRGRGQVISAADWNTVVGALIEVARSVIDDSGERVVAPHDHPDQVSAGWLDPRLRAAVERGPLADPVATARIGAVERGVLAAEQRIDTALSDLREIRTAASRVEASDLDRQATVTRLTRKVDGLADARDDVTALRDSLDVLRTDLNTVSAFANGMADVSPAELREGLRRGEELRTRLTTSSGALLDAAEIERRLTVLANTVVTEDELTAQLSDLRLQVPDDLNATLTEHARTVAQQQADAVMTAQADELRADIATRLAAVEATAAQRAAEAAGRLGDSLRTELHDSLTQELTTVISARDAEIRAELNSAIVDTRSATRDMVDAVAADVNNVVADRVRAELAAAESQLADRILQRLQPALTEVTAAVAALRTEVGEQRRAHSQLATSVAELRQTTTTAIDTARRELQASFTRDLRAGLAELDRKIGEQGEGLRGEIAVERRRIDAVDSRIVRLPDRPIIFRPPDR